MAKLKDCSCHVMVSAFTKLCDTAQMVKVLHVTVSRNHQGRRGTTVRTIVSSQ